MITFLAKTNEIVFKLIFKTPKEDKEFDTNLNKLSKLLKEKKTIETEIKNLEVVVKSQGIKSFLTIFKKIKSNPKSFWLETTSGAKAMLIPSDAYRKIDKVAFTSLNLTYGKGTAIEEFEYSIDPKLFKKYGKELLDLINKSKTIKEEDKPNLIKKETVYSVAKGAIDKVLEMKKPLNYLEDISPVFKLSNVTETNDVKQAGSILLDELSKSKK